MAATQSFTTNINDSSPTTYTTIYTNSASGVLTQAIIDDNRDRRVTYTSDMSGQVIVRDEDKKNTFSTTYGTLGPKEVWHRFNGREMQFTSNNAASTTPTNYVNSAYKRTAKPSSTTTGMFAGGSATAGYAYGDSDASFEGITSFKQGAAGGRYTVRGGETLQSIAQRVWGDSNYWYKIAEANGLSADAALFDGQALTLPAGVTRSSNNAATFKPYDASEAMGDTSPTRIKPPKPKKSGLFGKILLAVLVIAVTAVLTAGIAAVASGATFASSFSAVMGGSLVGLGGTAGVVGSGLSALGAIGVAAAGAAVGSIVGQGIGIATGLQDKFSWKSVGIAALAGGIGAGIGPGGALGKGGMFGANVGGKLVPGAFGSVSSAVVRAGLNGAVASALTQGVSVATGLQPKFDWAGVAAAGIGAGIGAAVGGKLGGLSSTGLRRGITGGASLIANASTRSLIDGSDFGDNVLAGLPDVITQTIGGFIEDGIAASRIAPAGAEAPGSTGAKTEPAPGETGQTVDPAAVAWLDGGVPVTAEQASSAAAAISSSLPGGAASAETGGFGAHGDIFGNDPLTAWLGANWLKTGRSGDFDDYVAKWRSSDAVAGLLYSEANGVAAGQLNNQFIMLGYLAAQGSQTAVAVAGSLYSRTDQALIGTLLPSTTLTRDFNAGMLLAAHYAVAPARQDVSNGYSFTNPSSPRPLNGWQRAGAAIDGLGHGALAVGLGALTVATAPAILTGVGGVIPVAFGLGTAFEADNSYTNFRMAWRGQRENTIGAKILSNTFSISPPTAELAYMGIQLGVGVAGGSSAGRIISNARAQQVLGGTYSADAYGLSLVRNGDVLGGGLPGPSSYYTNLETLNAAANSRSALWSALQTQSQRPQMGLYTANRTFFAASGRVAANPQFGTGGGFQYVVPRHNQWLDPIGVRNLGQ